MARRACSALDALAEHAERAVGIRGKTWQPYRHLIRSVTTSRRPSRQLETCVPVLSARIPHKRPHAPAPETGSAAADRSIHGPCVPRCAGRRRQGRWRRRWRRGRDCRVRVHRARLQRGRAESKDGRADYARALLMMMGWEWGGRPSRTPEWTCLRTRSSGRWSLRPNVGPPRR